jgi:predicted small metal-binding protein
MGLKLQCSDLGNELGLEATCPFVARGENMDELMKDMGAHAKEVHGYTDEQLQDPKTVAAVNKLAKARAARTQEITMN